MLVLELGTHIDSSEDMSDSRVCVTVEFVDRMLLKVTRLVMWGEKIRLLRMSKCSAKDANGLACG